jgi:ATP-dependent DNA helicase RecQ
MPTGGGKSLCYQLPALLFEGLTVVISPLIALMQDQVDQLRELGIPAAFLNSTLDYRSYVQTMNLARQGQVRLLYTSPETLLRSETLVLLDQSRVDCLTIDEAHCISQWGHDFRTEYRQLLPVRQRLSHAVCLAFTATATQRVRQDIMDQLGFDAANTFVASFNRKNLHLAAQPRTDGLQQVLAFLESHRDQSGIIYCTKRETVDQLAARLAEAGWPALPYHAGMDDATRQRNQRQFQRADVAIMVATIAFGMGINKPNVRFVLHFNLPKDVESYYQEIGRAGRDGLPADCLLLYGQQDTATAQYFIDAGAESERRGRTARLQAMMRYAQASGCRRTPLLAYFGEAFDGEPCNTCDRCLAAEVAGETTDLTEAARLFLGCVKDTGQIFGIAHLAGVLRGSQSQKILQRRHDRVAAYGAGRSYPDKQWRQFGQQFIAEGLLEQDMQHGGLSLTAKGREVLAGKRTVHVTAPAQPAATPSAAPAYDEALFQQLRKLRHELADAANVPPYVVFSDRSLVEMATTYPQTPERLREISGAGQVKLERYGGPFLAVIREYCTAHGLKERPKVVTTSVALTGSLAKRRFVEVGELFAGGMSIEQLQAQYGVQRSTIVNHLANYLREGGAVDVERVRATSRLSPEEQQRVFAVFDELGPHALNPVFEALGGTIPYDELHVLRVVYVATETPSDS